MSVPILSIVVPSKDRHEYLQKLIDSFFLIADGRLEFIIHDNSKTSLNLDYLSKENIYPKNFSYIHNDTELSMHENFELGFSFTKGKYVLFCGDDDFVTSEISKVLDYLESNDENCVTQEYSPKYWWPDIKHRLHGNFFSGRLRINKNCFKEPVFKTVFSDWALTKTSFLAASEIKHLPHVYFGIVKKDILLKVLKKYDGLFPGPTPDMSSATAIAFEIDNYKKTNIPFVVHGTGSNSGGGAGLKKQHIWALDNLPWFDTKYLRAWDERTPRIACGPTLWAEGFIQVSKLNNLKTNFNFSYLYALCLHQSFRLITEINLMIQGKGNLFIKSFTYLKITFYYLKFGLLRINAAIESLILSRLSLLSRFIYVANLDGPLEAIEYIKNKNTK